MDESELERHLQQVELFFDAGRDQKAFDYMRRHPEVRNEYDRRNRVAETGRMFDDFMDSPLPDDAQEPREGELIELDQYRQNTRQDSQE